MPDRLSLQTGRRRNVYDGTTISGGLQLRVYVLDSQTVQVVQARARASPLRSQPYINNPTQTTITLWLSLTMSVSIFAVSSHSLHNT